MVAIPIISYIYSNVTLKRTASLINIMIGQRITISYDHFHDQHITNKHLSNDAPLPRSKIKILLWSSSLTNVKRIENIESYLFPSYGRARLQCPISYLIVTDKEEEPFVDGVIIDAKQPDDLPREMRRIPWILYYNEPSLVNRHLENKTFMSYFNYSIGYRMDSDFPNPKISQPIISRLLNFNQKYDYVAAVFSTCNKIRTKYVQELSKHIQIKSYGDCLRNVEKNNLVGKGEINFLDSKISLLRMHKFALSPMKFDCEDYIDETMNHAWKAGTIPIYLGTDSLERILPKYLQDSYIQVSQFSTPKDVAEYLITLANDKSEYGKFMGWRNKHEDPNDKSPLYKIWNPMYSPACRIALALSNDRLAFSNNKTKTLKPIYCKERSLDDWLANRTNLSDGPSK